MEQKELKLTRASHYTVEWSKREDPNSAVFKYFLSKVGNGVTYWIPFSYKSKYYIMTFNNCYHVEVNNE